jgi:hypothetical protein
MPHDADPTASGESVKGGGHRTRCVPIHEDDPVARIGSSQQRLESGRGLRPPVTRDYDDSCDRCGQHEAKLTSGFHCHYESGYLRARRTWLHRNLWRARIRCMGILGVA